MKKFIQRVTLLKNGMSLGYTTCLCGNTMWSEKRVWSKLEPKRVIGYDYKCSGCGRIEKESN